jgi:hypothetical protein
MTVPEWSETSSRQPVQSRAAEVFSPADFIDHAYHPRAKSLDFADFDTLYIKYEPLCVDKIEKTMHQLSFSASAVLLSGDYPLVT